MNNNIDVNSGFNRTLAFIKMQGDGYFFNISDLKIEGVSYTSKRSIVTRLCEIGIIKRVCRGIYYYSQNDTEIPSLEIVLDKIAMTNEFKYCPSGLYAEYLIGIRKNRPHNCICYTNGKIKRVNLKNGISVSFLPSKRALYSFNSKEIMIVTNYLLNFKENGISYENALIIKRYLEKVPIDDFKKDYYLIPQIIRKFFPISW